VGGAPGEEAQVYYGIGPWWASRSSQVRLQAVRDLVHAKQELQTALTPNPNKEEATNINDLMGGDLKEHYHFHNSSKRNE